MTYSVRIKASAASELRRVDGAIRGRLVEAIDGLAENPFKGTALKGELKG